MSITPTLEIVTDKRDAPLTRIWRRTKEQAPRQKAIATTIATVRRAKPRSEEQARAALTAEAAKHGVVDLSDKELRIMLDAVVTSAKDAATQAVSKGVSGVKSLWANLQMSTPAWLEVPDNVAALNIRSDQKPVQAPVEIDSIDLLHRLEEDLSPGSDGERHFDCWLALEESVTIVHVGSSRLGRVAADIAEPVFHVLARRPAWTPATLRGGAVTITLPDHA
jgi:hypothetical protein